MGADWHERSKREAQARPRRSAADRSPLTPVLHLQRAAGNAAVCHLLNGEKGKPVQRLQQRLPYVGPLLSYLNPLNQLARAVLPGLDPRQKALLDGIFGNGLATSVIRLNPNSVLAFGNCNRTTGNIINIPGTTIDDGTLIHEAAHVWQHQNDIPFAYAVSALRAQALSAVLGGDWQRAYNYHLMVQHRIPWRYWNAEQQAQWIQDNRRLPDRWWLETVELPNVLPPVPLGPEVPFN